jgi:hypothetical protein
MSRCVFNCRYQQRCGYASDVESCPFGWPGGDEYLPLEQCQDGHVYQIRARNGIVGIFNKARSSFALNREKFGRVYLFDEYHWDTGEPHGTAKPFKDLGPAPAFAGGEQKLAYLEKLARQIVGIE